MGESFDVCGVRGVWEVCGDRGDFGDVKRVFLNEVGDADAGDAEEH